MSSSSSPWTKGERRARHRLEETLSSDEDNHVTRFALVRLLASKAEPVAAEELLRGPGIEDKLLADPATRIEMFSSLGGAYLMLWRARGEATSRKSGSSGGDGQGKGTGGVVEIRLDVSSERTDLLHRAQYFLEEALAAPKNLKDLAIRAQVAFCKEARGDCKEALALYAGIIADSALSPGTSAVIFRTSVLLAYVGRFDECVRYLEFIEEKPTKGCGMLLVQALLYTSYVSMGLEMKASLRLTNIREAFNDAYTAGRIGVGFSRDEIPWDRLPGWFYMWRELGVQSLRSGDYYAAIQMFSQATLRREDAETMVCTGEMLWVLGEAKRALALCERAYATDPLHTGAKRRLSAWAPEQWKERIVKEEERREAVTEMQRLADLSDRKAEAMLARRRRREKARVLRAWKGIHEKSKHRRRRATEGEREEARGARWRENVSTKSKSSGSDETSRSGSSFPSSDSSSSTGSVRSSRSGVASSSGDRSSFFSSSLSAEKQLHRSIDEEISSSSAPVREYFPVPSAAEATDAGRSNFAACFRAESKRVNDVIRRRREVDGLKEMTKNMAPVKIAAEAVHNAMRGVDSRTGVNGAHRGFTTYEMRALARFQWQKKTHEARITRVVYGS